MNKGTIDYIIKIPKEIARKVDKDKFVEVVTRVSDQKFDTFTKCVVDKVGNNPQLKKTLFNKAMDSGGKLITSGALNTVSSLANNVQTEMVRRAVKIVDEKVDKLTDITIEMSGKINSIFGSVNVIENLSLVNTGLSMLNIGVSVAGMTIMNRKLDKISVQLQNISQLMDKTYGLISIEIEEKFMCLCDRFRILIDGKECCNKLDMGKCVLLITDIKNFIISRLIGAYYENYLDKEICLNMINCLVTIYTVLIKMYEESYFFEYRKIPSMHTQWMKVYEELYNLKFRTDVFDYYFLDKGMDEMDSQVCANFECLSSVRLKKSIDNSVYLLETCENKATYYDVMKQIDNECVKKRANKDFLPIMEEYGYTENNAMKIFDDVFDQF